MEFIDIINSKNQKIRTATRQEAHQKALRHRAAACFLLNKEPAFVLPSRVRVRTEAGRGKVFLQRRSKYKKIAANTWDKSVGEHVQAGESLRKALIKGLKEELGITKRLTLKKIGEYNVFYEEGGRPFGKLRATLGEVKKAKVKGLSENELVWLYVGHYDGPIKLDRQEVARGSFFTIKEADKIWRTEKISPSFKKAWPIFLRFHAHCHSELSESFPRNK